MTSMSGRFVRASAYRHVFGKAPKPDGEFTDIKPVTSGEGNFIAANTRFFCYSTIGGGGPVVVVPLNKPGRLPIQTPSLQVHKDAVLDFDFNPFIETVLATAGEDLQIKLSQIPENGLTENIYDAVATLSGHERKINLLHWHPTANNVLGSASADLSLRVWDVEKQTEILSFNDFGDVVQSFDWNPDGSLIVTSSKDLQIRVYDPRNTESVIKAPGFTGPKSSRVLWQGDKQRIIAVGSSKTSARQYALWDVKKMSEPLQLVDIDTSAGVLMPYYDGDNNILYAAGKGDGNIRYWEVTDEPPFVHFLTEYRDNQSQKGITFLPKRSCDTKQCEIAVALRLMKDKVIPISFQVPRKSADTFQKDIYPDCYAGLPSMTSDEYFNGENRAPKRMSMNPNDTLKRNSVIDQQQQQTFTVLKSAAQLQKELDAANERIKQLEEEIAKLKAL